MTQAATAVDPFGFWQAASAARPVSFGVELADGAAAASGSSASAETAAAVWSLDLSPVDDGTAAITARADQVAAIEQGLAAAEERLDAFLARRAVRRTARSFAAAEDEAPERFLAEVLDSLESPPAASYDLSEALAARGLHPAQWAALRARLAELLESLNRQIAHFVWVDTTLSGRLAARTTILWSGDLSTRWWAGLSTDQRTAHQRSLALACAARAAQMQTLLSVAQMAGKIILAVATPLGPLQALALAWQFLHSIILPLLDQPAAA